MKSITITTKIPKPKGWVANKKKSKKLLITFLNKYRRTKTILYICRILIGYHAKIQKEY